MRGAFSHVLGLLCFIGNRGDKNRSKSLFGERFIAVAILQGIAVDCNYGEYYVYHVC